MWQYNAVLYPFVELKVVCSWASQLPSLAEPCGYMTFNAVFFMRLQSCRLCCEQICELGCVVTCSHVKWGWSTLFSSCACPASLEADLNLSPKWYSCSCWDLAILPPSPCKPPRRMPSGCKQTIKEWSLPGDHGHLLVMTTSWGSWVCCLACRGYRMLCRGILGPRSIFYVLPTYIMYHVLCGVTASAGDMGMD